MKKWVVIFVAYFLILAVVGFARVYQITFSWDPNTEEDLAGYRLYQSVIPGQYQFGEQYMVGFVVAGPNEQKTLTIDLDHSPGAEETYYWVVTAYDVASNESDPSNEVNLYVEELRPSRIDDLAKWMLRKFKEGIGWITKV